MVNDKLLNVYKELYNEVQLLPENELDCMFHILGDLQNMLIRLDNENRRYILKIQAKTYLQTEKCN